MSKTEIHDENTAALGIEKKMTRDELRAAVFSAENKKPKSVVMTFFGQQIELRQGTLEQTLAPREEQQAAVVDFLINNAYIPGSDERAFEAGDKDQFMSMPFGDNFTRVIKALQELSGVDFLQPNAG